MRRSVLGVVIALLTGVSLVGAPVEARTATVSTSIAVADRDLDLTSGGVVDTFRVGGRSSRALALVGVTLTRRDDAGLRNAIGSVPNAIYPTKASWTTKLRGDRYSGVWRLRLPVRAWTPAGTYDVSVTWRVGGYVRQPVETGTTVVIVNPHSDLRAPVLSSWITPAEDADLSLRGTPLVSFHVKDHGSGAGLAWICYLSKSDLSAAATCDEARLTSGTRWDGVYSAHLQNLPYSHLPNGPAVFRIELYDYAGWTSSWTAADVAGPALGSPMPGGQGDFTVVP